MNITASWDEAASLISQYYRAFGHVHFDTLSLSKRSVVYPLITGLMLSGVTYGGSQLKEHLDIFDRNL